MTKRHDDELAAKSLARLRRRVSFRRVFGRPPTRRLPMTDVFLSHSGADKEWVDELAARLEAESVDGRPLQVWFDKWDIDYGENILTKIEEGLKTSRFLAVVLSPAFTRADWPTMEWQTQVHSDPTGKSGRILPILLHKYDPETGEAIEIPLPLKLLRWFDFSDEKHFDREFARLVARIRGDRPARGRLSPAAVGPPGPANQEAPDPVEESLVSNLFPTAQLPVAVYSDLSSVNRKRDVWKSLTGSVPPFTLHGGRLYSFCSPDDPSNPFSRFLSGTDPRRESPVRWIGDPDKERLLIHLLNDAFREHCYHLKIRTPKKASRTRPSDRFQYFFPTFDGQTRNFTWGAKGGRNRQLAKVLPQPDGSNLGVHYAARIRFIALSDDRDVYMIVEPGWMFTTDGMTPVESKQIGVLSMKWGGKERNATVLRHVLMWGLVLANGEPQINIACGGGAFLVLETVPVHTRIGVGIAGDQIRLDRILGGEGAGEIVPPDEELDLVATFRAAGEIDAEEALIEEVGEESTGELGSDSDQEFLF